MRDLFYLLLRYLLFYRAKIITLSLSLALVAAIPLGLSIVSSITNEHLQSRAESTPLLLGAQGSKLDLVISTLYFSDQELPLMVYEEIETLQESTLTNVIPLYRKYRVKSSPIVGTTPDYFTFRNLQMQKGRHFVRIGECVLGSDAAKRLDVSVGDTIISSPDNVFDIAGTYPLKMDIVGVLKPTATADDNAVFTDIKTSWIIEGLAHGHDKLENDPKSILKREGETLIANASLMQYSYITSENMNSFHFHGKQSVFPVNAAIVLPHDHKSKTILMGRYMSDKPMQMLIEPHKVIRSLIDTVFDIKNLALVILLAILAATFAIAVLVFILSIRLRRNELQTILKIGASPFRVKMLLFGEIFSVLIIASFLVSISAVIMGILGDKIIYLIL
ncbi:MAG: ABC transporter permease [Sulfurimonadaceae bacterium]